MHLTTQKIIDKKKHEASSIIRTESPVFGETRFEICLIQTENFQENYSFYVLKNFFGQLPYPVKFQPFLFNNVEHIQTQQPFDQLLTFLIFNHTTNCFNARFQLVIKDAVGHSPYRGTFGGLECSELLDEKVLKNFWSSILAYKTVQQLNALKIKEKPTVYGKNRLGIPLAFVQDVNQHLVVSESPFSVCITASERRRLRKCERAGFRFSVIKNPDLKTLLEFVQKHRDRKNMQMTITEQQLTDLYRQLPDDFKIFAVHDGHLLVAMSVIVRLNDEAVYTFIPADHEDYLQFSPSVMLYGGIYNYCQTHGFKILDMGISSENGVLNEGLYRFKKHLGCIATEKITFRVTNF